jgi:hypothetical protein
VKSRHPCRELPDCGKKSVQVLSAGTTFAARIAGCAGRQCFVHDAPNGARASSTLRPTAKAAVNLARGAGCLDVTKSRPNVVITQHVAGTYDHGNPAAPSTLVLSATIDTLLSADGQKENAEFKRIPIYCATGSGPLGQSNIDEISKR